jgi:inner membrane protein
MEWWIWLLAGFALTLGELLTPGGFYLLFFGVGALSASLASALGLAGLAEQTAVFLVVSIASLLLFRRPLLGRLQATHPAPHDSVTGELALPMQTIAVHAVGQAELRGTVWSARNLADRPLAVGERCRVERVEGLTIYLRPEN